MTENTDSDIKGGGSNDPALANNKPKDRDKYKRPLQGRLLIIDGMALIYRAYFAIPAGMHSPKSGKPTSAVYGFTSMLLGLVERIQPEFVCLALEGENSKATRSVIYPEYKATRQELPEALGEQLVEIMFFVSSLMGIPVYRVAGCEADDVIAALTQQAEQAGLTSYISTADKDLLQLVSEQTRVMMPGVRFGDGQEYGPLEVAKRYGFAPAQIPLYLALKGDKIDNISGVPGIGEVTAAKLTAKYHTYEALLQAVDTGGSLFGVKPDSARKALKDAANRVLLERNLALTTLGRTIPDFTVNLTAAANFWPGIEPASLIRYFSELGFSQTLSGSLNRFLEMYYQYKEKGAQVQAQEEVLATSTSTGPGTGESLAASENKPADVSGLPSESEPDADGQYVQERLF